MIFLKLWWAISPSTNIKVYFRMVDFVRKFEPAMQQHFLATAFKNCTPRERRFLTEKGFAIGLNDHD